MPGNIADAMRRIAPGPDFQAALKDPANAEFAQQPRPGAAVRRWRSLGQRRAQGRLSFLTNLDPRLARPFLEGFSDSMDLVFLVGAGVMVFGSS